MNKKDYASGKANLCQWINLVEPDRVLWNLFPVQTKYRILRPIANLRMPKKASTFISLNTFLIKRRISTDSGSEEKKGSRQIGPPVSDPGKWFPHFRVSDFPAQVAVTHYIY